MFEEYKGTCFECIEAFDCYVIRGTEAKSNQKEDHYLGVKTKLKAYLLSCDNGSEIKAIQDNMDDDPVC